MKRSIIKNLHDIQFKNKGIVKKDMCFEYRSRPCHYMEDVDQWATRYNSAYYNYLYWIKEGEEVAPPSGMRSSVPLGGLGTGTIELRADGSLRDWNIFNNSPAGGMKKQLDEAMFYVWIKEKEQEPKMKILRTHPSNYNSGVEEIEYFGAYPVSKLVYTDSEIPVKISLYAYSEFNLYNSQKSATPAINFTFSIENTMDEEIEISLMFVLPNAIKGVYDVEGNRMMLRSESSEFQQGEIVMQVEGNDLRVTTVKADSLYGIQRDYWAYGGFPEYMSSQQKENPIDGAVGRMFYEDKVKDYGSISGKTTIKPNERKEVSFILAWYFPNRSHAGEILGNYYANIYSSACDVAEKVAKRIPETLKGIGQWQSLCFDNSLPEWLQDAMVNSSATMAKTGMWFGDGRWRQWESFSCPAVDPIHIHFYRVMPYAWFFNDLRRSQMYGFKEAQLEDGYIQENLGRAVDKLDKPIGRMLGDSCTTFVLGVYQDYLWTGDDDYINVMWPAVKKAIQWQIQRSDEFGLPNKLNNSYDWWTFEEKDLVSYNAFLHLTALLASEKLAYIKNDAMSAMECKTAFNEGQRALNDHFWNGEYYESWKNIKDDDHKKTLLSDTLYGQLWADILGLGLTIESDKLKSHLQSEQALNGGKYGLKVMYEECRRNDSLPGNLHNVDGDNPRDEIVWEGGSLDWCSLNINRGGNVDESLKEAEKIYEKWQKQLNDQWDIRDLSTAWNGEPYCNSHYARQLILWAIPLVISGQQYSAVESKLSFCPKVKGDVKLPFMTPQGSGLLEITSENKFSLTLICGSLQIGKLFIWDKLVGEKVTLQEDGILSGIIE